MSNSFWWCFAISINSLNCIFLAICIFKTNERIRALHREMFDVKINVMMMQREQEITRKFSGMPHTQDDIKRGEH